MVSDFRLLGETSLRFFNLESRKQPKTSRFVPLSKRICTPLLLLVLGLLKFRLHHRVVADLGVEFPWSFEFCSHSVIVVLVV